MNIVEIIRKENADRLDRPAVIDGERACSYRDLFAGVSELRSRLENLSTVNGHRVGFRCEDGVDYIVGSLALLESGAAIVPLDTSLTKSETRETLERIDVNGVLFQTGAMRSEPGDVPVEAMNGATKFFWRPREASGDVDTGGIHPAFIRFSSGTTGASKGVVLSHQSIRERTDAANQGLKMTERDRVLWVLSMSHHFVVSILLFLRKGATIIVSHRDFPISIVDIAAGGGITFIYASPFHYELLSSADAVRPDMLKKVRMAISTAMKLPASTAEAFASKFGFELTEAYGIIEVGLPFINLRADGAGRGAVGKALPAYDLKLENRDDKGVGEVLIKGPGMFDAYFSPWRAREDALSDGWFRTGDLGRIDDDGNLIIVGRSKTVIICAGMKIFPEEVEEVLNSHPDIVESLVFGVEHASYGQIPGARIVASHKIEDEHEFFRELRRYCYSRLSSYKTPKLFEIVAELPKTPSGKLIRH